MLLFLHFGYMSLQAQIRKNEWISQQAPLHRTKVQIVLLQQESLKQLAAKNYEQAATGFLQLIQEYSGKPGHLRELDTALSYFYSAIVLPGKSITTWQYGHLEKALFYTQPVLKRNLYLANLRRLMGLYWMGKGIYAEALRCFQQSLDQLPPGQDTALQKLRGALYTNIGAVWSLLNATQEANKSYQMAAQIAIQQKDTHNLIGVYTNQGSLAVLNNATDSAYYYYTKADYLAKRIQHPPGCNCQVTLVLNRAQLLIRRNQPDEALSLLNEIPAFPRKSTHKSLSSDSEDELVLQKKFTEGYAYAAKGDYSHALPILLPLLDQARHYNWRIQEQNIHDVLSEVYEQMGNFEKALQHRNQFTALQKETQQQQSVNAVDVYIRYFQAQKNKELLEQQLVINLQKSKLRETHMWLLASGIGLLLLGTLSVALFRNHRHKQNTLNGKLLNARQQQEITLLQAKVEGEEQERSRLAHELHDGIVSQLVGLKLNLDVWQQKESAAGNHYIIRDFSVQLQDVLRDLRQTAYNLMPHLLMQKGLELSVATLCEKTAKNTGIEVDFQMYGTLSSLDQETELSLFRIVQELLQNVLKHASATQILVQITCHEQLLNISVEDNGCGFPVAIIDNDSKISGSGLRHIKNRVAILKGSMDIKSKTGFGTAVYIELNLS